MLCDICQKNIATVHLTEIINDKVIEMHICQACAQSKAQELSEQPDISNFLAALAGEENIKSQEYSLKCSFCGLKFGEFKKKGRLGCSRCYLDFKRQLLPLLKKIHGSSRHIGKIPLHIDKEISFEIKLEELRKQLKRAIQLEEYEDAAHLRDEIKRLEKRLEKKNKNSRT